jgi:quercetin dioxygenase-like cupin family protein
LFPAGHRREAALTPFAFPWKMLRRFGDTKEAYVSTPEKIAWTSTEMEKLNDTITRQMISGDHATISQLFLQRGAIVPRHSHINEQYSWILSGTLRFTFDDREIVVGAGEVLVIPPNVPHSVVALEDTLDADFFTPRREDWIKKEDAYLRR